MPPIRFFLADADHPIDSSHPLWQKPLPDRNQSAASGQADPGAVPFTYGDYFNAVEGFCAAKDGDPILNACRHALQRSVTKNDISGLGIFLEKHGALYHPARLRVTLQNQNISFVINVAASSEGRLTLPVEMSALKRLAEQRPFGWLPTVYAGTVDPLPMFLADWFEGYHEFHLTRPAGKPTPAMIVWDGADPPTLLTEKQSDDLYRQAAMILTACYDPITTDQIYPWHHAAGDFVVRVKGDTVDLKLITARNYAPFFKNETAPADERALLDGLIAFFVHLSIRMRLDRIDGVSEIVWAPDACLFPMTDGFFKGLDLSGRLSGFPETFPSFFHGYVNHQGPERLMQTAKQLARNVFHRQSEEGPIVDRHIERHMHQLFQCMADQKFD